MIEVEGEELKVCGEMSCRGERGLQRGLCRQRW